MSVTSTVDGIEIKGALTPEYQEILTPEAQQLLVELHRKFNGTRLDLLKRREDVQAEIDKGNFPDFDPDTKAIREGDWTVAELPEALLDRRTEITGPVDRKMVINALNSGAKMFMADFEDASTPSWANMMSGQINMRDANAGTIAFHDPNKGKDYKLKDDIATLLVRPRGWHLVEKHVLVDGEPISGSIFDFALYMVHNAKQTLDNGKGPYFYFPEARALSGGAVVERCRRLYARPPRRAPGQRESYGAHREHLRELLLPRDSVRIARAFGGLELRPVGLYF